MKNNDVMWNVKWLSAFFCIANIKCSMIVGNYEAVNKCADVRAWVIEMCRGRDSNLKIKSNQNLIFYLNLIYFQPDYKINLIY
jgi:hypothetical protein